MTGNIKAQLVLKLDALRRGFSGLLSWACLGPVSRVNAFDFADLQGLVIS
jgi:hypothetical protein